MIEEGKDKLEWTRKVDQTKAGVNIFLKLQKILMDNVRWRSSGRS